MPSNPKVAKAFRAMKNIGISQEKVKPVLKNLLKLYDKNWELIEEENYRALADAIFEKEEAEVQSILFFSYSFSRQSSFIYLIRIEFFVVRFIFAANRK